MKIKTILAAALAFTVVLGVTGCNETGSGSGDEKSVMIKLDDTASRAVGDPVGTSAVTFNDGHLFFVSSTGQITKYFTIGSAATSETNINLTQLKNTGVEIKNVADNSRTVYILGNLPAAVSVPGTPVGLNISAIKELAVTVQQLSDGTGGVTAIPLYGMGTINTTPTPKTVNVRVEAIASRIEIQKFDLKPGAEIATYQIDGIFVNYYYSSMQVDGTVSGLVDNGTENDSNTKYIGGNSFYPNGLPLWDYNSAGTGLGSQTGTQYLPSASGKLWAYNVFPGVAPHIIVRLSGVKYKDGYEMADPQYLTARTYNNKAITSFENGKVYLIESFLFDENDLTDKPEIGQMDIEVKVTLVPWATEPVTADL